MSKSLRVDTSQASLGKSATPKPEHFNETASEATTSATLLDDIRTLSAEISREHAKVEKVGEPSSKSTSSSSNPSASTSPNLSSSRPGHSRKNTATTHKEKDLSGSVPLPSTSEAKDNKVAADKNLQSYESLESEFKERRGSADVIFQKLNKLAEAVKSFHDLPSSHLSPSTQEQAHQSPRERSTSNPDSSNWTPPNQLNLDDLQSPTSTQAVDRASRFNQPTSRLRYPS